MTPAAPWHPAADELQGYVDGRSPLLWDASVEAHLQACARCRLAVRDAVPAARLAAVLDAVADRIDALDRSRLERLLCRVGVAEADARALLAAPSLRVAWWGAVAASVLLALLIAGQAGHARQLFLLLAPLIPAVSTAAAYAYGLDPAAPIVTATPYHCSRLLLFRSLAVGTTATLGASLAGLALPSRDVTVVLWLLPALALTLGVLALSHWVGTGPATGAVGAGWFSVVVLLQERGSDALATFDRTGQLVSAAVAAIALAVVATRWQRLDEGGAS